MVIGNIKNAEHYYSINPYIELGLQFLLENMDAAPGRYTVDGDNCFVMISDGVKRSKEEAKLEVHNRYIDVQTIISGDETYGYKARVNCTQVSGQFDEGSDIGFFEDEPTTYFDAHQGDLLLFFPADGHAPLIGNGVVRKAVIKVRVVE